MVDEMRKFTFGNTIFYSKILFRKIVDRIFEIFLKDLDVS